MEILKLNNLQLAGKIISERVLLGVHSSKKNGMGTEFEQYRHYLPGDDLKRIDWKLYARSGKHLVKESLTESHMHVRFVIDMTASMNYEEEVSRLTYAKTLVASLSYLAYRQNDPQSLFFLKNGKVEQAVAEGRGSFQKILYTLESAKAEGGWPQARASFPLHAGKELVVFVSDLLQMDSEWTALLKNMASPKRQILVIQLLGEKEKSLDLKGFFRFDDLEGSDYYELDADSVKKAYKEAVGKYLEELKNDLLMPHVHLIQASLQDDPATVISQGLKLIRR
ncbi:DUF58 domain-containing protein [Leadbetterella byssophila]|uniref:DUF58 domain-containing protein n=1 Tax=Leadbetterella byssophila TaxID=316068 RepID=UPI0039A01957